MRLHLIFGAPGSGKGSLAKLVNEKFALTHLSTGDILRDSVSKETEVGLRVKASMANGTLVDDDTVNGIVFARLQDETRGVLFDGYPRTLKQAIALDDFLSKTGSEFGLVVYIDVPMSVLESRIVGRRVCGNNACGAIYHVVRKKPVVDGICDFCNGLLIQRSDDTSQAFHARMAEFNATYEPMLAHYRGKPNYRQVDGIGLPDEVFNAISMLYEEYV
ncbi:MAG: nucleoside monophosphate kinase [Holophagaceae bacterium]|nr:nucleoside monophosphate kinase [Holophagaceae bacterium]